MKHIATIGNIAIYAPRKNEPADGNVLDKISDDFKGHDFHYIAVTSESDTRINGYGWVLQKYPVDFAKYNLIIVNAKNN